MLTNSKYLVPFYFLFFIILSFSCTSNSDRNVSFTEEEIFWLENKGRLTLSVDNTYPPLSFHDENGELVGLNIDLIKIIESKIGIPIIFVGSLWNDALKKAMNHEVDGVINATPTIERKGKLNFTINFIQMQRAFIARKGASFDLQDDKKKYKIATIKGTAHVQNLRTEKPNFEIIEVMGMQEAFKMLIFEEVDMIYHDLVPAKHLISTLNLSNLKIVSIEFDAPSSGIGLRNDDDMLMTVMNKAINGITRAEMSTVKKKWIAISEKQDYTLLFGFSIVLIIIVVAFLILNWSLRNSIKIKSKEFQEEFQERKKLQSQMAKGQRQLIALIKNGAFELSMAHDMLMETNNDLLEGKMSLNQTLDYLAKTGNQARFSDKQAQLQQLTNEIVQNKIINLLNVIKDGIQIFLLELRSASVDKVIGQNPIIEIVEDSIEQALITADTSKHFELLQEAHRKCDLHVILDKSLKELESIYGGGLEAIKHYSSCHMEIMGEANKLFQAFHTLVSKVCESLGQIRIQTSTCENELRVEILNDLYAQNDKTLLFEPVKEINLTSRLEEENNLDIQIAILLIREHQGTIEFKYFQNDLIHVYIKFPGNE